MSLLRLGSLNLYTGTSKHGPSFGHHIRQVLKRAFLGQVTRAVPHVFRSNWGASSERGRASAHCPAPLVMSLLEQFLLKGLLNEVMFVQVSNFQLIGPPCPP